MILYDLIIGLGTSIKGCIWCTDGSFVSPRSFKGSGKVPYGYALSNTTVVSLTRSRGKAWSPSSRSWYRTNFTGSQSWTDGVSNSDYLKSQDGFSSTNCPAVYYACTQTNAGVTSYMPARDELSALYSSIRSGDMKIDLTTAGLYESCNYRLADMNSASATSGSWYIVWSSSQSSRSAGSAWYVNSDGGQRCYGKYVTNFCVIPFFKV